MRAVRSLPFVRRQGLIANCSPFEVLTAANAPFGAVPLFTLVTVGGLMVLVFLLAGMFREGEFPAWIEVAMNVVVAPFGATMPAVCYFLLRTGKENVDAKDVAAVFD